MEEKFKIGDWIVNNKDNIVGIIRRIHDDGTCFMKDWHLWTIEDAKDGNVLANCNVICIFRELDEVGNVMTPCIYTVQDGFKVLNEDNNFIDSHELKPATQEQIDLLFKKMREAGYEWDSEKHELKKKQEE